MTLNRVVWSVTALTVGSFALGYRVDPTCSVGCLRQNLAFALSDVPVNVNLAQSFDTSKSAIQMLKLQSVSANIHVKPSINNDVTISLKGVVKNPPENFDSKNLMSATLSGEMLEVEVESKIRSLKIKSSDLVLEIGIPIDAKRQVFVQTVSGDVKFDQVVVESLNLNTVSGDVESESVRAKEFKVKTVSGDVDIDATSPVSFKTVSGDVKLRLNNLSNSLQGQSVSGDVSVKLSPKADAQVQLKTVSGDIASKLSLQDSLSSKRSLTGALGKGTHQLQITTMSGEISLLPL